MARTLLVSNRLPVTVELDEDGRASLVPSVGGLATSLSDADVGPAVWIGWPGAAAESIGDELRRTLREEHGYLPVDIAQEDLGLYYDGFANNVVWPVFHDFPQYASFRKDWWEAYARVNAHFADVVAEIWQPGDRIWVHDYHLMLLPSELRERLPKAEIGFFLHIPFPTSDLFRMIPWRNEILEGLLGADVIGFHTYDYVRHFLSSVLRLLGLSNNAGNVTVGTRVARVDAFPLGVDVDRFALAAADPRIVARAAEIKATHRGASIMTSVDRLDYTKGIPQRLSAFARFLEEYPEWRRRIVLLMVAVPSRTSVEQYQQLKRDVDEVVGRIEGTLGETDWSPVSYMSRAVSFEELVAIYLASDVMLVTPLADGMNLVAKEYVAAVAQYGHGALIVSEMAGAARELGEAIVVNPYDTAAVTEAMGEALGLTRDLQSQRLRAMLDRLRRYDVHRWTREYLEALDDAARERDALQAGVLSEQATDELISAYRGATERLVLLDYDGTLVGFDRRPSSVAPSKDLIELLRTLAREPHTQLYILSGRGRDTLEGWFGSIGIGLAAEHGAFVRHQGSAEWEGGEGPAPEWKDAIRQVMQIYVDRTPGAFLEEKERALVWHYRAAEPLQGKRRARELRYALGHLMENAALSVTEGRKVIEVREIGTSKGEVVTGILSAGNPDFVLAIGDDVTDEDMFAALPPDAWSIKVGMEGSRARFRVASFIGVRALLTRLASDGS